MKKRKKSVENVNTRVYQKGLQWDQKRQTKLAAMRETKEAAQLEDCTFKPLRSSMSSNAGATSCRGKRS